MAALIGVISQKGGVGKSTIARLVAREYAAAGWQVRISTSTFRKVRAPIGSSGASAAP
jgi:cellulose biosynthesis protein BcsQ